ncbi:glycosyltransferase family 39 protein [Planctomycetota bacterium]
MIIRLEGNLRKYEEDFVHVAILMGIALAIGIYLITTTVLIAKDGIFFIEQARQLSTNPSRVIRIHPPGYPFLIFAAHKFISLFGASSSSQTWAYIGQSVSLLCRVLSLIPLYFIGKLLVGARNSFCGVLILVILPYPAEFGSDVLRDWPYILFLSTSLLFLFLGIRSGRWWMFGLAGLVSGAGLTIRMECGQVAIYAILWLVISLFLPKKNLSRLKSVCLTLLLLICFASPSISYIKAKGKVLSPKLEKVLNYNMVRQTVEAESNSLGGTESASGMPYRVLQGFVRLGQELCENLMYFFVWPLIIGLYCSFRHVRKVVSTERLFIVFLIVLYLLMLLLLYINYGYISRRHCMPMVVFTIFYIPVGLRVMARGLSKKLCKNKLLAYRNRRRLFFALAGIGLVLCIGKFSRITPLRLDKLGYKETAAWLKANTTATDIVAVPKERIAFYADRKWVKSDGDVINKDVKYIVRIVEVEEEGEGLEFEAGVEKEYSVWVDKRRKKKKLVVYKMM